MKAYRYTFTNLMDAAMSTYPLPGINSEAWMKRDIMANNFATQQLRGNPKNLFLPVLFDPGKLNQVESLYMNKLLAKVSL